MKFKLTSIKYLFLLTLSFGIANKTPSPNIKNYAGYTLSELNEMCAKKEAEERKQRIISELKKPVSDFYIPVSEGQISSVYGPRKVKGGWKFHKGIDIGVKENASIRTVGRPDILAAASGIVSFAGKKSGYGNFVKINHTEGWESGYGHLNEYFVKEGDTILAPQIIGKMGRTGKVRSDKKGSKIHLHFEIIKNGKHYDPAKYSKGHEKISIDDIVFSMNYLPTVEIVDSLPIRKEGELYYGIQIAASLKPLSKKDIQRFEDLYGSSIKEGNRTKVYKNGRERMYYKYSIGNYKTLEEALIARKSIGPKDNLGIVVYKKDKIVKTEWKL